MYHDDGCIASTALGSSMTTKQTQWCKLGGDTKQLYKGFIRKLK